jgi:hypothetical protein
MSFGYRGRAIGRGARDALGKAYGRRTLGIWDAKWHRLSDQARFYFLNVVKGPAKNRKVSSTSTTYSVVVDRFPPHILEELRAAGFVEIQAARGRAFTDRVIACDGLYDFAVRVRALQRLHPLRADQPSELRKYVDYVFQKYPLLERLGGVLRQAGIVDEFRLDDILERYVTHGRWPGWVAKAVAAPLAVRVLNVIHEAGGPLPLAELPGRIQGVDPDDIRLVVDNLVSHLALVEDLDPKTWDVLVGFLPKVREELVRAGQPRDRPSLSVCEHPKEARPDGSAIVNDLRAVLFEIASEPPSLRQDHSLFQKQVERFRASLEPLAGWLNQVLRWSNEWRLSQAIAWARALRLVEEVLAGKTTRLHLTSKGQTWLASGLEEQCDALYTLLRPLAEQDEPYSPTLEFLYRSLDPFSGLGAADMRFLGEHVTVLRKVAGKRSPYYWDARAEDYQALRTSLDRALSGLKPGVFYRLDSVESHLAFGEHNPLNCGLDPDQVVVFWHTRQVPALEDQREEAGRLLIDSLLRRRLIPLGCVRVAIDEENVLCIAREPRCDAYFGRKLARPGQAPASEVAARVVVQPDFSVIVIGLNPATAADLAPFCERASQRGSPGALVLRITRESVVKAVSHGLEPAEIVDRLRRHASNEVPANVLREVREWSAWVRQVTSSTLAVLRCPDRDTADRVMGALKRQAERVNDTLVAIDQKTLTAAERSKLRSHGIIVRGDPETPEDRSKGKRRRRR